VAVEELMSNKEHATLSITGLFMLSLTKKKFFTFYKGGDNSERIPKYRWVLSFRPSHRLKMVINDEEDIHELIIGGVIPLYPKEHEARHGKINLGHATPKHDVSKDYVPVEYKLVDVNEEKRNELKKRMALEQVNNILEED
jgi:hypothetical protein